MRFHLSPIVLLATVLAACGSSTEDCPTASIPATAIACERVERFALDRIDVVSDRALAHTLDEWVLNDVVADDNDAGWVMLPPGPATYLLLTNVEVPLAISTDGGDPTAVETVDPDCSAAPYAARVTVDEQETNLRVEPGTSFHLLVARESGLRELCE